MNLLDKLKSEIKYLLALPKYKRIDLGLQIMSIDETLEYMSKPGNSIVRFGDGEFSIIEGRDISHYQKCNAELQLKMSEVLKYTSDPKLLVCMPEPLRGVDEYVTRSRKHWTTHIANNYESYRKYCDPNVRYGNSFVSRPYMIYKDKSNSGRWIEKLISIFSDKTIVLVEGKYSRSGVGNDMFSKAASVKRILCPPTDAYEKYDEILSEIMKTDKCNLILLAVGPTGKPLALELVKNGYWVLDIGHIDSEYEWYLRDSDTKVRLDFKHTAEAVDEGIPECTDEAYLSSVICDLTR